MYTDDRVSIEDETHRRNLLPKSTDLLFHCQEDHLERNDGRGRRLRKANVATRVRPV